MTSERGPRWVWEPARKLDAIAGEVARDWGITIGERFPMARYSFAGPAGDRAVLKIAPAEDDEADLEARVRAVARFRRRRVQQ